MANIQCGPQYPSEKARQGGYTYMLSRWSSIGGSTMDGSRRVKDSTKSGESCYDYTTSASKGRRSSESVRCVVEESVADSGNGEQKAKKKASEH